MYSRTFDFIKYTHFFLTVNFSSKFCQFQNFVSFHFYLIKRGSAEPEPEPDFLYADSGASISWHKGRLNSNTACLWRISCIVMPVTFKPLVLGKCVGILFFFSCFGLIAG